jgi:predicted Zn-dependent peptidase
MRLIHFIAGALVVGLAACSAPKVDRSSAPAAGPAPQINIGKYETFTLDNGLKVIVVENNKLPRVSYSITVDRGPLFEGDRAGYASFAGGLMSAGTTNRSKAEIDAATDFIGASMSTSATGIFGSCLTKHSDALLGLMQDVLLNPTFPEEELEKVRKQTLSGLASAKTSADDISGSISGIMTYGKEHPYGEPQTEKTVAAITREDLIAYYDAFMRPNISYLVIVGDISSEAAVAQANKYFGAWKAKPVERQSYEKPTAPAGNRVAFVPLRGAVQSVIDITAPVDLPPGHPDAIAASVMNNILGGGVFGGRLMQNLREDKAFTYGARANLSTDPVIGRFSASASVRNEVTDSSVVEFLYEIERITTQLVEDSTLQFIKNYMNGSFARSLESPQTIARFALNIERYNLPKDYYATYLNKLEAVTAEDVLRVAQRYLDPNKLFITVVGNKDEVGEKLARFAKSGKVEYYDMHGEPYTDLQPAPEGMTANDVFNAYYAALGGVDNLKKINTYEEIGTMAMGPMSMAYSRKVKSPDKMLMQVKMGEMELMKQIINGKKGSNSQMGQSIEMSEEEVGEARMQIDLIALTRLADYGMSAVLKGIGSFNDEPAYVVEMMKGGKVSSVNYYSVATGFELGSEMSQETPQGDMTIATNIKAYAESGGVKFPSHIVQQVGPQTIEIKLDEVAVNKRINDADFK